MVRALVVAALLLGACKKSAKPDCDGAGKAVEANAAPAIAANVVLRCKQDGWSAAAADCVKSSKAAQLGSCESKLTKDQLDKYKATIGAIDGSAPAGSNVPSGAGGNEPPSGPPADCAGVEASMTRYWSERVTAAKTDAERNTAEELRAKARTLIGKHCTDDKWSFEAGECFKSAPSGDLASCAGKLTQHQMSSLKMSAPAIPNPLPGPPAPPAGGSEAGSAEAGSAGSAEAGSGS